MRSLLFVALLMTACRSQRGEPPEVQFSSSAPRDTDVRITSQLKFLPACVVIQRGQTVEWWLDSAAPDVPVNVTSLGRPVELFSPNFGPTVRCGTPAPMAICWRHSFAKAGCFNYFDTNSGSPGRPVVDDYYGTVTFIGESGNVEKGLICVEGDGVSCAGVCCNSNLDCASGFTCQGGRCLRASDQTPSNCPAQ